MSLQLLFVEEAIGDTESIADVAAKETPMKERQYYLSLTISILLNEQLITNIAIACT